MLLSSAKEANMTRKGANGWGLARTRQLERDSKVSQNSVEACVVKLRASAAILACVLGFGGVAFAQSLIPAVQAPTTQPNAPGTQPATTTPAQQTPQAPAQNSATPAPAQQTPAQPAT